MRTGLYARRQRFRARCRTGPDDARPTEDAERLAGANRSTGAACREPRGHVTARFAPPRHSCCQRARECVPLMHRTPPRRRVINSVAATVRYAARFCSTQNGSFRRLSSRPVFWLGTVVLAIVFQCLGHSEMTMMTMMTKNQNPTKLTDIVKPK